MCFSHRTISATTRKRWRHKWVSIRIHFQLHPTIRAVPFRTSRRNHLRCHTYARKMEPFLFAIVIARNHLAKTDIIADAISRFIRILIFRIDVFVIANSTVTRFLFLLVLIPLRTFNIGNCFLSVFGRGDISLWWRLLTHALTRRRGHGRLTENAVAAQFATVLTPVDQLRFLALSFRSGYMAPGGARTGSWNWR